MSTKSRLISGRVPVTTAANVAADRYQYLDLSSAEPNLGSGNTGDVLVYDSSYPGSRRWILQSDIRGSVGEYAFVQANTASANTVYLTAVDASQNTRLDSLETVNNQQNTSIGVIQGVDVTQNSRISTLETQTQAAFDKANTSITTSGGSITGSLSISQNLTVTGNLTVLGNSTTLTTNTLDVGDSLIYLANNNLTSDAVDIGIIGHYNDGANAHAGIIRDPNVKEWIFFKGYTPEVQSNNLIDVNHASFAKANVQASYFKGNVAFSDGTTQTTAATGIDSYARTTANTATNNITILQGVDATQNTSITAAFNQANAANILAQAAFNVANTAAAGSIDQTARTTANNASSNTIIIQGVDTTQNTRMTVIEGVDVGQNTRMSIIEGVNTTQNTNITIIQGVDTWQNTQITTASSLAQGAFNRANSGARATTSNTAPTGNTVGDLWLSLTDETLYMYSYDGTSNNWVDISGPILRSSNIVVQYTITANVS